MKLYSLNYSLNQRQFPSGDTPDTQIIDTQMDTQDLKLVDLGEFEQTHNLPHLSLYF